MTVGTVSITGGVQSSTGKIITNAISEPGIFKNFVLGMVGLSCSGNLNYAYPADLTTDGYPVNGAAMTFAISAPFRFPSFLNQSDVLVVAWTGTCSNPAGGFGGFALRRGSPGFTITSDPGSVVKQSATNLELQGTNGYVEFQFATSIPSAGVTLSYNAGSSFSNNFKNLIVCRKTDYASVVAAMANNKPGDMITDEFVSTYRTLNARALRFMGPINTNFSNFAQSRYLPNWRTGITCGGGVPMYPTGCWAGSDSTNTGAYVVSLPPDSSGLGSYYDGETIICQLQLASTGNVTLNSGGRGAVTVYQGQGGSTGLAMDSSNSSLKILGYAADGKCGVCTFVYSSIVGAFLHISDGPGVWPIIAYELQAAICNRVGCDLYTNFPFLTDDASTTAITQIVRDNLKPGLKAYFEYGNEIWNNNYRQTPTASLFGKTLGFTNDGSINVAEWVGLRSLTLFKLVSAAWAPRASSQLKRVIAFQAASGGGTAGTTYIHRLTGAQLAPSGTGTGGLGAGNAAYSTYCTAHSAALGGLTDFTAFPNRPADGCDVLSYAPYYNAAHIMQYSTHYVQAFSSNNAPQKTITGISQASPGRITSTAHGYSDHDRIVTDATIGGMTQLRSTYASVKVFDANNYDLYQDFELTVPLDTSGYTAYTSGGKTQRQPDMTGFVQAAKDYEAGSVSTAFSWIDTDYLTGTNNDAGNTNNLNLAFYNGTSSTSPYKGFEACAAALEGGGSSAKTIECYEGGASSDVLDIPAMYLHGLTKQATITFNASTGPSVNWTAHPLKNGYVVGFTVSGGSMPSNISAIQVGLTISGVGLSGNQGLYVVNSTANGFDLSATYGGSPITPASTGSGTITAIGSQYGFNNLYLNYKFSTNFKNNVVLRQFHQFMGDYVGDNNFGALTHSVSPTVFMVVGPNAWSMSTGDSFAAKYTNWDAAIAYNFGLG